MCPFFDQKVIRCSIVYNCRIVI
uniref:Uncharacterized protein n=1 Tax=Anopheles dirus TaxID=7168 RepID=A0A182NYV1_9DIPT